MRAPERLLIIIPERLSDIAKKGEIIARYYNPGDLFREIHFLLLNDDRPDPQSLSKTVGSARALFHNIIPPRLRSTWGMRPFRLRQWIRAEVLPLIREIRPDLVRCYGEGLAPFIAARIRVELGIGSVVSLHTNPDADQTRATLGWKQRLLDSLSREMRRQGLRGANLVLPVYEAIVPYLRSMGVEHYEVAYNTLNPESLRTKKDYTLGKPPRIISVGRQIPGKDPTHLIQAVGQLPQVRLTLVGSGPLHQDLRKLVDSRGWSDRIEFFPSMPNDALCEALPSFDLFAIHTDYWELNKSLLEALLTGLPCIVNHRPGSPVPELVKEPIVHLVPNTAEGYRSAIATLLEDHAAREGFGKLARETAHRNWFPAQTEARFVSVYRRLLAE